MSAIDAVTTGLIFGLAGGWMLRLRRTSNAFRTGSAVVVKWSGGIGRASVLEASGATVVVSSPLMRESYPAPPSGAELVLKPISGGKSRRGAYLCSEDAAWKLQLK